MIPLPLREEAISLRKQGKSYGEISAALSISLRTVKTICKGVISFPTYPYKTLTLKHTENGTPYYEGLTRHGYSVELDIQGNILYTGAGHWDISKEAGKARDLDNCRKALSMPRPARYSPRHYKARNPLKRVSKMKYVYQQTDTELLVINSDTGELIHLYHLREPQWT